MIKVSKPLVSEDTATIFGNAASAESNGDSGGEILDVTMAKYGHHLAFHVIHPEIGEDGSIKPVTGQQDFIVADEDGTITSSKEDSMERKKDVQQQSAPKSDPRKCISWRQTEIVLRRIGIGKRCALQYRRPLGPKWLLRMWK